MDAAAASKRLGVAKATLYAYVSRGLLRAHPDPADPRARRYAASEIEALCERRDGAKRPTKVLLDEYALAALDKARPIVRTSLTTLVDGVLHYRGRNALELARHSSVEEAARWLWKFDPESNPAASDPFKGGAPTVPAAWNSLRDATAEWPLAERTLARFAMAQQAAPAPTWLSSPNASGARLRTTAETSDRLLSGHSAQQAHFAEADRARVGPEPRRRGCSA